MQGGKASFFQFGPFLLKFAGRMRRPIAFECATDCGGRKAERKKAKEPLFHHAQI